MALAVYFELNPQARPFVPTTMTTTLPYHRGNGEGEEEPVSKHHMRSGNEAGRGGAGGTAESTPRDQIQSQEWGQGKEYYRKNPHKMEEILGA